jgi:hypothetical protein
MHNKRHTLSKTQTEGNPKEVLRTRVVPKGPFKKTAIAEQAVKATPIFNKALPYQVRLL